MEFLDNIGHNRLGDTLASSIDDGAKISIISAYFTVFAYRELKEELSRIDEVRFLFSEPTFVRAMEDAKDPRRFELERRGRERGVGGVGLELTLSNNLDQRAIARECAEWVRGKGTFRSARMSGTIQPGGAYVVENPDSTEHGFMGATADFTQEGLGYEHRLGTVTGVSHFEGADEICVSCAIMRQSLAERGATVVEGTDFTGGFHLDDTRYVPFFEAIAFDVLPQEDLFAYVREFSWCLRLARLVGKLGFYPDCSPSRRQRLLELSDYLDALTSERNSIAEQRRNKELTLNETAKLRIRQREMEKKMEAVLSETKEACND